MRATFARSCAGARQGAAAALASPQTNTRRLIRSLVGELLEMKRNFDPERIRGFHIDHELELRRAHDRKVCWALALQRPEMLPSCS